MDPSEIWPLIYDMFLDINLRHVQLISTGEATFILNACNFEMCCSSYIQEHFQCYSILMNCAGL